MSSDFEPAIATYLTLDGHVFLAPQYNLAFDRELNEGGTCPDFVALDVKLREIIVVEVTTAANFKPLSERVKNRETNWFRPILRTMKDRGADEGWKQIRFLGFVRSQNINLAKDAFAEQADVAFAAIEESTFPWLYWTERMNNGLPR